MKTYTFHTDPGHGWLAVKRQELEKLGLLKEISPYSYQRGQTVYLEEDSDANTFIKALEANGIEFKYKESYQERSPVRSYDNYEYERTIWNPKNLQNY